MVSATGLSVCRYNACIARSAITGMVASNCGSCSVVPNSGVDVHGSRDHLETHLLYRAWEGDAPAPTITTTCGELPVLEPVVDGGTTDSAPGSDVGDGQLARGE